MDKVGTWKNGFCFGGSLGLIIGFAAGAIVTIIISLTFYFI